MPIFSNHEPLRTISGVWAKIRDPQFSSNSKLTLTYFSKRSLKHIAYIQACLGHLRDRHKQLIQKCLQENLGLEAILILTELKYISEKPYRCGVVDNDEMNKK